MSYTQLRRTKPIARKNYRCVYCGEKIHKGEKHIHEISIFEGEFQDHRWHKECLSSHIKSGEVEFDYMSNDRPKSFDNSSDQRHSGCAI